MVFYRLLSWLPLPLLYALAWPGYLLLYYVAGYRKTVVAQNLAAAFPDHSEREITVLAKKFYRQFVEVALEIIRTRRMSRKDIRRRVQVVNGELVRTCSNDFRDSVIVLTLHQGNWEWMLHGVKLHFDVPVDPVYKPLHNRTADRLIYDIRSRFGSRPLAIDEAARDILRRRREFRLFVMVADQSPIRRERTYWTRFMNRDAAFYPGAEVIARTTGFPVVFAQCRRLQRGRYQVVFHELAHPPYDREGNAITEAYVRLAEEAIRSEPESWMWSNRRWKRDRAAEQAVDPAA